MRKCAICGKDTGPKMWLCKECWKIEADKWLKGSRRFVEGKTTDGKGSSKILENEPI